MYAKELKSKSLTELNKQLKDLKKDLETFASNVLQGKEKNVKKGLFIRKDIARVKTVLNEKGNSNE